MFRLTADLRPRQNLLLKPALSQVIAFDHWCIFNAPFVKLAGELVVSRWSLVFSRLWPFGGTFFGVDGFGELGYFGGSIKRRHRGRYLDTGFSMLDVRLLL